MKRALEAAEKPPKPEIARPEGEVTPRARPPISPVPITPLGPSLTISATEGRHLMTYRSGRGPMALTQEIRIDEENRKAILDEVSLKLS